MIEKAWSQLFHGLKVEILSECLSFIKENYTFYQIGCILRCLLFWCLFIQSSTFLFRIATGHAVVQCSFPFRERKTPTLAEFSKNPTNFIRLYKYNLINQLLQLLRINTPTKIGKYMGKNLSPRRTEPWGMKWPSSKENTVTKEAKVMETKPSCHDPFWSYVLGTTDQFT